MRENSNNANACRLGLVAAWSAALVGAALALTPAARAEVSFTPATVNLGAADTPWSVVSADLDADGDLDVLSASQLDDAVRWYESDGATPPVFTARVVTTLLDGASAVHVADIDRDGDLDVVASGILGGEVAWYENDGASPPAFFGRVIDGSASAARSVYSGDLDRDGDLDVLSANEGDDAIVWYESDGAVPPSFTKHVISSIAMAATSVTAADIDSDGDLDVLSTSEGDAILAWYENDGAAAPAFTRRVIYDEGFGALWHATADLDGDGDLDVALASTTDNMISWFENDGASPPGWVGRVITLDAQRARSVATGDLDADGDVDIASGSESDDKVSWYENDGASPPSFTKHDIFDLALGTSSVAVADVDRDGDLDLLSSSFNDNHIRWYANGTLHSGLAFADRTLVSAGEDRVASVEIADIDHDGHPDLVSAALGSGESRWFENDGAPSPGFSAALVGTDSGANSIVTADIDVDGDEDLLVVDGYVGALRWYENDGAVTPGFSGTTVHSGLFTMSDAAAGDLDADGDPDIVVSQYLTGSLFWLIHDGAASPSFSVGVVAAGFNGVSDVDIVDLDRDGNLDVLSTRGLNGDLWWHDNDGVGVTGFTPRNLATGVPGATASVPVDLDRDGDLDVVVASTGDDTLVWFQSDGAANPGFSRHVIDGAATGVSDVLAVDFDRDGDLDVVAALAGAGEVAIYQSDGLVPPGFAAPLRLPAGLGVRTLASADIDRDGFMDLAAGSADDDTLAWYRNESGQYALVTDPTPVAQLLQGVRSMLLAIDLTHLGRAGEGDIEAASLAVRFERSGGIALSDAEFNAMVDTIEVYADDGSGEFESGSDSLVLSLGGPVPLSDGLRVLVLPDALGDLQVPVGSTLTLFVVLELDPAAASQPVNVIRAVHLPGSGSAVEESSSDTPLRPAGRFDAGTAVLTIVTTLPECADGVDNDGDSLIDFPADPGCKDATSASKEAPQCNDGVDNDLDTFSDFPADPQCTKAYWDDESQAPKPKGPHCGIGFELAFLLPPLIWLRDRRVRRKRGA